ncbi:hypothetical protein D6D28_06204 [Aureobasidium pullulans]|uniref:Uncharacterized protein n=1 Tax=Aureobasidium pullulans TaxID=5580 RepID=A0A4S8SET1_AURPU|nr:hypothetical protein D6D28_06204 [Aureobasidium pullulans]
MDPASFYQVIIYLLILFVAIFNSRAITNIIRHAVVDIVFLPFLIARDLIAAFELLLASHEAKAIARAWLTVAVVLGKFILLAFCLLYWVIMSTPSKEDEGPVKAEEDGHPSKSNNEPHHCQPNNEPTLDKEVLDKEILGDNNSELPDFPLPAWIEDFDPCEVFLPMPPSSTQDNLQAQISFSEHKAAIFHDLAEAIETRDRYIKEKSELKSAEGFEELFEAKLSYFNDCITVWEDVVQECQKQYKKFADAA